MRFKKTSRKMGIFIKNLKICKKSAAMEGFFFHRRVLQTKNILKYLLTKIIFVTKICAVISKRQSYIISKRV